MATGFSYKVIGVPGEVLVISRGSATNPTLVMGNPNDLDGMNDGFYHTGGPGIGLSINGSSVATWTASGLVTGAIATSGAITAASVAVTGALTSSSPTAGVGYATGAGGTVTQGTSKAEGVTLNTLTGAITLNNASLAAGALVTFTVTNSTVGVNDAVIVNHAAVATLGPYDVQAHTITAGSFKISLFNHNGTALAEAITLRYTVIKGASA